VDNKRVLNYTNNLIKEVMGYMVQSFPIQSGTKLSYTKKKLNKKSK
jgi:hypothetical protein